MADSVILVFGSCGQQVWLSSPCLNIRHVKVLCASDCA